MKCTELMPTVRQRNLCRSCGLSGSPSTTAPRGYIASSHARTAEQRVITSTAAAHKEAPAADERIRRREG